MNDRYQSRVLRFNTKRVVCPTLLGNLIAYDIELVLMGFFMINVKTSHLIGGGYLITKK